MFSPSDSPRGENLKRAEVENNIDDVIKQIETTVIQRLKSPPWGI